MAEPAALMQQIPAALRSWFSMLKDAQLAAAVEEYTRRRESPPLLQQDIRAAALVESGGMAITASGAAREVVAAMEVDDGVMLELAIRLPPCYPLQPAEARPSACCACRLYLSVTQQSWPWLLDESDRENLCVCHV